VTATAGQLNLEGKVAVVTGGAGALGLAAARMLLEEGLRLAIIDIDALRLDGVARFLRGEKLVLQGDVSDAFAVRSAHERVCGELGPVDILVNAAGASPASPASDSDEAQWRRVLAAGLEGAFLWSRAVLPGMVARGWGRIVNVGGSPGANRLPGAAQAVVAGGLVSLTSALARESAAQGVTVNTIAPAFVRSPAETEYLTEAQRRQALASIPAGRFGEPEEFAHAVRFLVSPLAGYVTGQTLGLDGGLHLR
jgi:3-oxoacyl-[acyl-carrier protein] reductase